MDKLFELIFLECCKFAIYFPLVILFVYLLSYLIIDDVPIISFYIAFLIYMAFRFYKIRKEFNRGD